MFGKAEVTDLYFFFLEENILRFEVAVHDAIVFQVEHGVQDLPGVHSDPIFVEFLRGPEEFRQIAAGVLHDYYDFGVCFKAFFEHDDVVVFDFGEEVGLGLEVPDF